jgi:biotin operon repressor
VSSKSDRQKKLIAILQGADSWVSAASLSKLLGTTERTVRNYVRELEGTYGILSSQLGYRLQGGSAAADTAATTDATSQTRARDVVIELLSSTQPSSSSISQMNSA